MTGVMKKAYLDPLVEAYNAQSDVAEVEVEYFAPTEYAEKILNIFFQRSRI